MVLLGPLALEPDRRSRRPAGGLAGVCRRRRPAAVAPLLERRHDALVLDVARRGENDVRADVCALVVAEERAPRDRGDHLGAADHRATERMRAEDGLRREVVDDVLRVVVDHRDLLEHDLALGVDVRQRRGEHHVRHHVERHVEVIVGHARVDDRRLARRGGVELAAHRVEQLRDLHRVVALGALEEQVLDEVGDAGLGNRFVARARPDPEPDRRRAHAVDVLGDDPLPAGEGCEAVGFHGRMVVAGTGGRVPCGRRPPGSVGSRRPRNRARGSMVTWYEFFLFVHISMASSGSAEASCSRSSRCG